MEDLPKYKCTCKHEWTPRLDREFYHCPICGKVTLKQTLIEQYQKAKK